MLFITQPDERPDGYVVLSESTQWVRWLNRNIPEELDSQVRRRLISNLKHLLVGLELKAALVYLHQLRSGAERSVLYEPYFQNLILEFCVATFSVVEGLGSAHWLSQNGSSGADGPHVRRDHWLTSLCVVYDESGDAYCARTSNGPSLSGTGCTRIGSVPARTSTGTPSPSSRRSPPPPPLSALSFATIRNSCLKPRTSAASRDAPSGPTHRNDQPQRASTRPVT